MSTKRFVRGWDPKDGPEPYSAEWWERKDIKRNLRLAVQSTRIQNNTITGISKDISRKQSKSFVTAVVALAPYQMVCKNNSHPIVNIGQRVWRSGNAYLCPSCGEPLHRR